MGDMGKPFDKLRVKWRRRERVKKKFHLKKHSKSEAKWGQIDKSEGVLNGK